MRFSYVFTNQRAICPATEIDSSHKHYRVVKILICQSSHAYANFTIMPMPDLYSCMSKRDLTSVAGVGYHHRYVSVLCSCLQDLQRAVGWPTTGGGRTKRKHNEGTYMRSYPADIKHVGIDCTTRPASSSPSGLWLPSDVRIHPHSDRKTPQSLPAELHGCLVGWEDDAPMPVFVVFLIFQKSAMLHSLNRSSSTGGFQSSGLHPNYSCNS
ncbi:hypothetical protein M9H77_30618 [Catharanthus roseus]|uniref:Uncharacterized protein n=1 Tax=Catharanthus roseus TaxID=4058 RepID=A0ACC0A1N9_CATRO|nr:hypothetical protein M9H77_30618 [Catharanthus roseus]